MHKTLTHGHTCSTNYSATESCTTLSMILLKLFLCPILCASEIYMYHVVSLVLARQSLYSPFQFSMYLYLEAVEFESERTLMVCGKS